MRRRDLLGLLLVCSVAKRVEAQAVGGLPSVGFIGFASAEGDRPLLSGFRGGLRDLGHVEGQTILLEARHAGGDLALAARFIEELARKPVTVFVAPGPSAARALRRVTQIPVVAINLPPTASDPDLFASLARPGGTVTGFSSFGEELSSKRVELIREVLLGVDTLGILHNGTDPIFRSWGEETERSVRVQGLRATRMGLTSPSPHEMIELLRSFRDQGGRALIVVHDFLTATLRSDILRTTVAFGIAAIAEEPEFARSGALLSYGPDTPDLFRRAASYVDRIIKGERAGDLPVQLPTKFNLVVNLKTARALNLEVPPAIVLRADEIIE